MTKRKKAYSTAEAAGLLDCSAPAVIRWVEEGKLRAYKTPGGHRRILKRDLEVFAREFGFPLSFEEAEQFTVLVIDDDPKVLEAVRKGLASRLPFVRVDTAGDAVSGLIALGRVVPDLLVLDLKPSGMDGLEVLRRIREDPASATVKVLAVGAHLSKGSRKKLGALGVSETASKPFDLDDLARKIDGLLRP